MLKFILKRLLQMILVLFLVATLVFVILRAIGDPAKLLISPDSTFADLEQMERVLGLDKPLYRQYLDYMWDLLHLDFGNSFYYERPVIELIAERVPATLQLGVSALLVAFPLSLLVGIVAAVKRGTWIDNVLTSITIAGRSIPTFWLGLVLILFFSVHLHWLPASGYGTGKEMILPLITMAAGMGASNARLTRSAMLDVMRQDYMTTARAKGVAERRVILAHGLRNALLVIVTMLALQVGFMLSGSVVVETVFAWPGVGRLMITAITDYDFPLVQACAIIMAFMFVLVNFIADICYMLIDPRIRYD